MPSMYVCVDAYNDLGVYMYWTLGVIDSGANEAVSYDGTE